MKQPQVVYLLHRATPLLLVEELPPIAAKKCKQNLGKMPIVDERYVWYTKAWLQIRNDYKVEAAKPDKNQLPMYDIARIKPMWA